MSLLDRLTTHARRILGQAAFIASESGSAEVEPIHILLAIATERGCLGAEILTKARLRPEMIGQAFGATLERTKIKETTERKQLSTLGKQSRRVLEKAALAAATHEHRYVGSEHLLAGIIETNDERVMTLLDNLHINIDALRQHLELVLKSTSKFPELTASIPSDAPAGAEAPKGETEQKTPAIDFFAKDLTAPNIVSRIDPVIGREEEINRVIQVLCRRTKNNPILVGEPGVGKTAIAEGLARKIVERDVPDVLANKRIIALDLALVVAGTVYRGEFESRLKQILDEVRQDTNLILFIDEIHTIMGAGAASGSLDAANILKPALARGEIRCIGATTYAEFKKHIENDAALERRFQIVHVAEPSAETTVAILHGLKPYYEQFHHVRIADDAVDTAVRLAERYLSDRRFPDKAIDLIDEAAARIRVQSKNDPLLRRSNTITAKFDELEKGKRRAVLEERYADATSAQNETERLQTELERIRKQLTERQTAEIGAITCRDVAAVVAQSLNLPIEEILTEEQNQLRAVGERLRERIVGQDHAIREIAAILQRAKSGLTGGDRPLASFLLLGPTGVGKTETAKVIAELLFPHRDAFIRIDMSEFSEGFTISKLIGAPAGYVGYREGSKLTDAVRRHPASVVLFDEIEKAHPDVWNLLLQILEDGRITDAIGREVRFHSTVIILTSNVGTDAFTKAGIGFLDGALPADNLDSRFEEIRANAIRDLRTRFRPELLSRIDATIVYRPIAREHLAAIAERGISMYGERLRAQQIALEADPEIAKWIAERAFDPLQGARAVRRLLQEHIENQIATGILDGKFHRGDTIRIVIASTGKNLESHAARRVRTPNARAAVRARA
ncbi:MAG: ATP-dependent Clp protease ATP-binding subunit [Candidatus Uhrbacteria bacterium]